MASFPHRCPSCGNPAYVGLASISCRSSKCKHYDASDEAHKLDATADLPPVEGEVTWPMWRTALIQWSDTALGYNHPCVIRYIYGTRDWAWRLEKVMRNNAIWTPMPRVSWDEKWVPGLPHPPEIPTIPSSQKSEIFRKMMTTPLLQRLNDRTITVIIAEGSV